MRDGTFLCCPFFCALLAALGVYALVSPAPSPAELRGGGVILLASATFLFYVMLEAVRESFEDAPGRALLEVHAAAGALARARTAGEVAAAVEEVIEAAARFTVRGARPGGEEEEQEGAE